MKTWTWKEAWFGLALLLLALLLPVTAVWSAAVAESPARDKNWAAEVFGNNHGAEGRFLWLGPQGGAVGLYGGLSDDVLPGEDGVIRFGVIGRYDVIRDGNAPVGDWLPKFLDWFKSLFFLPATTPVDTYAGLSVGGMYGQDHGDLSYEVRPLLGLRVGFIGFEFGRGLGDLVGETDSPSGWTWSGGVTLPF